MSGSTPLGARSLAELLIEVEQMVSLLSRPAADESSLRGQIAELQAEIQRRMSSEPRIA